MPLPVASSQFETAGYTLVTHGAATDLKEEVRPVFRIYRFTNPPASDLTEMLFLSGVRTEDCQARPVESFTLAPLGVFTPALALEKCDATLLRSEISADLEWIAKTMGQFLKVQIKISSPRATALPKLFMSHDDGTYTEIFVSFQTEITPTLPDQDVSKLRNPFNMAAILISNSDCKAKGATQYFKI